MTDCPSGDVRDLLPELLHGRLDPGSRRTVEAHVATCADCRAELALLTEMRAMLHARPAIDVGAIVAALPAATPARRASRGSWLGWRTAAAVTMLAAGGTSVALIQRGRSPVVPADSVSIDTRPAVASNASPVTGATATPASSAPIEPNVAVSAAVPSDGSSGSVAMRSSAPTGGVPGAAASESAAGSRELAIVGSSVSDLTDRELATLLKNIDGLDGVPSPDVESVDLSPLPPREVRP